MRIVLASEELTNRPREGTLVFLMHLCRFLHREADLTAVHARGEIDADLRSFRVLSSKLLLTKNLLRILGRERFDLCIYVPISGLTAFGLARASILRALAKAPTIAIGLQDRPVTGLHRIMSFAYRPDLVLSPAVRLRERLEGIGFDTDFIMPGFDDRSFKPASPEEKARLRTKLDLPRDRYVVLHVGHIKENRNLEVFLRYRDWGPDILPVIKAGEIDPSWAHRLRMAGLVVIDEYFPDMHKLYQAADCYLFPVSNPMGAVEFPLSVIEACACNLPVVTTRFGALPEIIHEGNGFHYYDRVSEIAERISDVRQSKPATAAKVRDYSWDMVFRTHLSPHVRTLTTAYGGTSRERTVR
jgi:glycosyltransferase involved in cell wall biosynthesis